MVVEDEVLIAMDVQSIFEDAGAEVLGPARTLAEGMELASKLKISAAVLDVRLGRDSVDGLARLLKKKGVPFLFYSGQPSSEPTRLQWPDITFVAKPATPPQLVRAMRALLKDGHRVQA